MKSTVDGEDSRKRLEYGRESAEPLWRWFVRRSVIFIAMLAGIAVIVTAIGRVGDRYGWFDFLIQK